MSTQKLKTGEIMRQEGGDPVGLKCEVVRDGVPVTGVLKGFVRPVYTFNRSSKGFLLTVQLEGQSGARESASSPSEYFRMHPDTEWGCTENFYEISLREVVLRLFRRERVPVAA